MMPSSYNFINHPTIVSLFATKMAKAIAIIAMIMIHVKIVSPYSSKIFFIINLSFQKIKIIVSYVIVPEI